MLIIPEGSEESSTLHRACCEVLLRCSIIWRRCLLLPVHMHFYCIPHGHVGYRKHGLIHCNSDEKCNDRDNHERKLFGVCCTIGPVVGDGLFLGQNIDTESAWRARKIGAHVTCCVQVEQAREDGWLCSLWWSRSLTQTSVSCCYPRVQFAHGYQSSLPLTLWHL